MHNINLDELSQRPLRAFHADGISELVMGATWLVWSLCLGVPLLFPRGAWWDPYWSLVWLILVFSGLLSLWSMKKLKERWTYQRAGYVQPLPASHGRIWSAILTAMVTAAVIAGFMTRGHDRLDLIPLGCSVIFAGAIVYGFGRHGIPGGSFYGVLSVGLGIAITLSRTGMELGFTVLLIGLGIAMTIGGSLRLIRFLKSRPEVPPNAAC